MTTQTDTLGRSTRFTLIIPYHLGKDSDRVPMMEELWDDIPDRDDLEVLWVDDRSALAWTPRMAARTRHQRLVNDPGTPFAGGARNTGLRAAQGSWVFFADSDDRLATHVLADVMDTIVQHDDGTVDAWYGDMDGFIDPRCASAERPTRHLYSNALIGRARHRNDHRQLALHYGPCGKIVRRSFLEAHAIRFGPWRVGEDSVFSAAVALRAQEVRYYPTAYYKIREGHETLMSKMTDAGIEGTFAAHRAVAHQLAAAGRRDLMAGAVRYTSTYLRDNPSLVLRESLRTLRAGCLFRSIASYKAALKRKLGRG